jgi:hypothetical protein
MRPSSTSRGPLLLVRPPLYLLLLWGEFAGYNPNEASPQEQEVITSPQ